MKNTALRFCCITLVLVFLAALPSTAADTTAFNGNWWTNQPEAVKLVFVLGFMRGDYYGQTYLAAYLMNAGEDKCADSVSKHLEEWHRKRRNITTGQVRQGLDELFKDFRNRQILVEVATEIVFDEITGVPAEQVQREIEAARSLTYDD